MRIIMLVLELAILSLIHPTYSSPMLVKIPRDLDSDQQDLANSRQELDSNKRDPDSIQNSEQHDPGDSMNELITAEIPEEIPQNDISSGAPQDWHDPDIPTVLNPPPPPSWDSTGTSTKQPTDPTGQGNTDTVNPNNKPKTNNDDSTKKPNSDTTGPSDQQNSAATKQPEVLVPFDYDTPADEQIEKNTWYLTNYYKSKTIPDFHPIPYSNKIPATEQIDWNAIDQQLEGNQPTTLQWSNTIPASAQIRQIVDEAESKVRNDACKAARAKGSPIDCLP